MGGSKLTIILTHLLTDHHWVCQKLPSLISPEEAQKPFRQHGGGRWHIRGKAALLRLASISTLHHFAMCECLFQFNGACEDVLLTKGRSLFKELFPAMPTRRILPFQLKKTSPLLQVCEDPLSTGHSVKIMIREKHVFFILNVLMC